MQARNLTAGCGKSVLGDTKQKRNRWLEEVGIGGGGGIWGGGMKE